MKPLALTLVAFLVASPAVATAQNKLCVPVALGVPTREGPPDWVNPETDSRGVTTPADKTLDDPRWEGAVAQTFSLGSATAPLQVRALYSPHTSTGVSDPLIQYMYLSVIVDLAAYSATSAATPRDLFLGFRRPGAPANGDQGYILQFHLTALPKMGATVGLQAAPQPCDSYASCDQSANGIDRDYWRVFSDDGMSAKQGCDGTPTFGREYQAVTSSQASWITNAVGYWKYPDPGSTALPFQDDHWAVQIKIPIVKADATQASAIGSGIETGSTFFYEASAALPPNELAPLGWFPVSGANPFVCPNTAPDPATNRDYITTLTMSIAGNSCPNCSVNNFAQLTNLAPPPATPPAGCSGFDIDIDHIGSVTGVAPTDPEALGPGNTTPITSLFVGNGTTNHVVAVPINLSSSPLTDNLQGRFRLAEWGSGPWGSATDSGQWQEIRGAVGGVHGKPGTCAIGMNTAICAGKHALITFDWTIGNDLTLGDSEFCKFGLPLASGTCQSCTCTDGSCGTNAGKQAPNASGGFWPCTPVYTPEDQCMLVELNAPDSAATFVHSSTWRNMSFRSMSTTTHTALIDARKLPTAPGQQVQDIYFIAVPRNMPSSVAATTTTSSLVLNTAITRALQIAQPYLDDIPRQPPPIQITVQQPARPLAVELPPQDPRIKQILAARAVMPPAEVQRIDNLLAVIAVNTTNTQDATPNATQVHTAVNSLGASAAAEIVPTLEIYPFYLPLDQGRIYQPMTSFSLFLTHEATLSGINFDIDGADQVGANLYHMQIPVGFAREIQIRAQALGGSDPPLGTGMPKWPCTATGGCAACGGAKNCGLVSMSGDWVPGAIAGVFLVGFGRRRRRKKPD